MANAQPRPAVDWGFNVSDVGGPLGWGTILNTDGDIVYPSCAMDAFPAPRRFHDVHLSNNGIGESIGGGSSSSNSDDVGLAPIRLDYLTSSHFSITLEGQGTARPSLTVRLLDIQCTARHPRTGAMMALQRIEFLVPAENEMGYVNGLEVHLVHAALDSNNVPLPSDTSPEFVIAVFYDGVITGGTPEISKILARAPTSTPPSPPTADPNSNSPFPPLMSSAVEVTDLTLDASLLFPARRDYIFYRGVVPRPPCTTQADYALLVQNLYLSTSQTQMLRSLLFGANLTSDAKQRNAALVTIRNKAALSGAAAVGGGGSRHTYFVGIKHDFPLEMPPAREPFSTEAKVAIAGFVVGALSALVGLTAIVFSLCRPRTRLTKKDETAAAAAAALAAAAASSAVANGGGGAAAWGADGGKGKTVDLM